MSLFFLLKLVIVAFFLVMFLRGSRLVWGIGLLTVTTAFLLDTLLGTLGREAILAELGFFFYVISGGLFAGAAIWLFGLLRPLTPALYDGQPAALPLQSSSASASDKKGHSSPSDTTFDRQMIYEQIRDRMGPEDVLDLMFDLSISQNEVISPGQDMHWTILHLMDLAEARGLTGSLAFAVERILTPVPKENLPRLERIDETSPPTVLRQYLLAYYPYETLQEISVQLGIDWEQLAYRNKKSFVRSLLLYLDRRNRVGDLIDILKAPSNDDGESSDGA